jgi:hypothetical protein
MNLSKMRQIALRNGMRIANGGIIEPNSLNHPHLRIAATQTICPHHLAVP